MIETALIVLNVILYYTWYRSRMGRKRQERIYKLRLASLEKVIGLSEQVMKEQDKMIADQLAVILTHRKKINYVHLN